MFDYDKTIEFYVDWMGFTINWEHTFEPGTPRFIQVSQQDLVFFLSEHHGDGSPGAVDGADVLEQALGGHRRQAR